MKSTVCEISCWRRKYIFFFLMMISALHSVTVFAQKRTISGTVVDERNEPLIGATIVAEGKSGMTITNVDGKFTLAVPDKAILRNRMFHLKVLFGICFTDYFY